MLLRIHRPRALVIPAVMLLTGALLLGNAQSASTPRKAPPTASAENGPASLLEGFDDDGDVLDGFDEAGGSLKAPAPTPAGGFLQETADDIDGALSLGATVNFAHTAPEPAQTDWRGLSRFRPELQLSYEHELSDHAEFKVSGHGAVDLAYRLNGRSGYTEAVLNANEDELELDDTYLLLSPERRVDVKIGRQIVVWGRSDTLRVTDVLNPLDQREPGLTDIEYLRLPVTMTRVDTFRSVWRLSAAVLHEIRFDKTPAWGSDFYPAAAPLPPEETPASGLENTELGLAAEATFSRWDLSLYAADVYNDTAHLEPVPTPGFPPAAVRRHARLKMIGAAANVTQGNWLLKAEAAWLDGFKFFSAPGETFSRTDLLAGIEYSGFTETLVTLEVANRHLNGFDDRLANRFDNGRRDAFQSALRITRNALNDTLELSLLAAAYGAAAQEGAFQRVQAQYDLTDAVVLTAGVVFYQSGDLPETAEIGANDRLFLEVAYHF